MSVMMCCVVITTALIKCAHMRMVKQTGWTRPNDLILREPNCQPLASHHGQAVFLYPFRVYRRITDNLVFRRGKKDEPSSCYQYGSDRSEYYAFTKASRFDGRQLATNFWLYNPAGDLQVAARYGIAHSGQFSHSRGGV